MGILKIISRIYMAVTLFLLGLLLYLINNQTDTFILFIVSITWIIFAVWWFFSIFFILRWESKQKQKTET